MATQKLPPEETHDERVADEEIADAESWEFSFVVAGQEDIDREGAP